MMRFLSLGFLFASLTAAANPDQPIEVHGNSATLPLQLNMAYGRSLPESRKSDQTYVDPQGPSRSSGGEVISIRFRSNKNLTSLRLTAFSKSGQGRVLVHKVSGDSIAIPELFIFADVKSGQPENNRGLVMLTPGSWVESQPKAPIQQLDIRAEGFDNNDATLLVEMKSPQGFLPSDFIVRRSSSPDDVGGSINESDYQSFTARTARLLMRQGRTPRIDELKDTKWVCSIYYPNRDTLLDYKTRQFFGLTGGPLQSTTDLNGTIATWILTPEGLKLPTGQNALKCEVSETFVIRLTPAGNTIAEYIFDRNQGLLACMEKGLPKSVYERDIEAFTAPSDVNARYRVTGFEFCRPAAL